MNSQEFRQRGKEMVDYIADYLESISQRRVTSHLQPGYLKHLIPEDAPVTGESWDDIMKDVEKYIMPGMTHWQHPRFHAYFPSGNAYPSILADMLSDGIACIAFSWAAGPACTELEMIMMDWLGKMIGLPKEFLHSSENSTGGGVIQGSSSDSVLVCLLAARFSAMTTLMVGRPFTEHGILLTSLVAYCSRESHSSIEKAALLSLVKLRILVSDKKHRLRASTLEKAIKKDREHGLHPFFVVVTLGTTSSCAFDPIHEIGPICQKQKVWLHVDAAYAGSALICPEFRYLLNGIEYVTSFTMNPTKWMLVNFDCTTMWVRNSYELTQAFVIDPLYLQHSYSGAAVDYRHWGIPLSRRFRSLKLWFVIRSYGVKGLQKYIREHIRLAKEFEMLVRKDERFEVMNEVQLALVCFRLKGNNDLNQRLLSAINASGKIHMVPSSLAGKYTIRFCVCAQNASSEDMVYAWKVISEFADELLQLVEYCKEKTKDENGEQEQDNKENDEQEQDKEEEDEREREKENNDEQGQKEDDVDEGQEKEGDVKQIQGKEEDVMHARGYLITTGEATT